MGHIAHLRNQFKSINTLHQTNGYIITLIRSGKKNVISFLRIECSIFVNPWVPFTHFLPSLVEIGLVVLKKKTLNFISVFSLFLYDLPLGKGSAPSFEQFWIPFTLYPGMLCAKFGWNWLSGSGEEIFLILSIYFSYFLIKSPWKRAWPFIWTNLIIPITQGCFLPSLVEIVPAVLKKIFKVCQCIFAISLLSPLGKGHGP